MQENKEDTLFSVQEVWDSFFASPNNLQELVEPLKESYKNQEYGSTDAELDIFDTCINFLQNHLLGQIVQFRLARRKYFLLDNDKYFNICTTFLSTFREVVNKLIQQIHQDIGNNNIQPKEYDINEITNILERILKDGGQIFSESSTKIDRTLLMTAFKFGQETVNQNPNQIFQSMKTHSLDLGENFRESSLYVFFFFGVLQDFVQKQFQLEIEDYGNIKVVFEEIAYNGGNETDNEIIEERDKFFDSLNSIFEDIK